ncbi:MAG TPA: sugar O-acetyltransferase [Atopostipes sp.]|nr:sugar O-acetyltransferase [Atopostipes sp.]
MNEYVKMLNQEWYDANNDSRLFEMRRAVQDLCYEYNHTRPSDLNKRNELLKQILGELPTNVELVPPIWVDYGKHIKLEDNVFVNADAYFMDGAPITIGSNTFIGPKCGFYTATHPENIEKRNAGLERALPITIGKNVWLGANVFVMPGVTIGEGSIIGAGSTVTKDIPTHSVAVGTPCRVVRSVRQ